MRRLLRLLLGACGVLLLMVVVGELFVRATGAIDNLDVFPRQLFIGTSNPGLPYRLRPGVVVELPTGAARVNRAGLRGPEIEARPSPGVSRILALGDSVVFGHGVEESETFPLRLGEALEAQGHRAEVLNLAAPGYDTRAEVELLRSLGLGLGAQGVVLGVSLNDFDDPPWLSRLGFITKTPPEQEEWLPSHSELFVLLRWSSRTLRGKQWWQQGGDVAGLEKLVILQHHRFYTQQLEGPAWQKVRRALIELRDLTDEHDLRLLVTVFPASNQLAAPGTPAPQRAWQSLCEELGLRYLDLLPAFAAAGPEASLFVDLQHPNAAGLELAAQAVARELLR